jgi:hypothetical protein
VEAREKRKVWAADEGCSESFLSTSVPPPPKSLTLRTARGTYTHHDPCWRFPILAEAGVSDWSTSHTPGGRRPIAAPVLSVNELHGTALQKKASFGVFGGGNWGRCGRMARERAFASAHKAFWTLPGPRSGGRRICLKDPRLGAGSACSLSNSNFTSAQGTNILQLLLTLSPLPFIRETLYYYWKSKPGSQVAR